MRTHAALLTICSKQNGHQSAEKAKFTAAKLLATRSQWHLADLRRLTQSKAAQPVDKANYRENAKALRCVAVRGESVLITCLPGSLQ